LIGVAGRALGADEQHGPPSATTFLMKFAPPEQGQRLLEVDDVDLVAFAEDVRRAIFGFQKRVWCPK
jgi:hypothetical protein